MGGTTMKSKPHSLQLEKIHVQQSRPNTAKNHSFNKSFLLGCSVQFSSVAQWCLTLCNPMDCSMPGLPSPTPGVYSNSCPLSQWCHPTISSSVVPFSSCLHSFPGSGSFQMSQLFTSRGQSIGLGRGLITMYKWKSNINLDSFLSLAKQLYLLWVLNPPSEKQTQSFLCL